MFCSEKASTREDAWPVWLMNRFPISSTAALMQSAVGARSQLADSETEIAGEVALRFL